jgi:hypothetical protein
MGRAGSPGQAQRRDAGTPAPPRAIQSCSNSRDSSQHPHQSHLGAVGVLSGLGGHGDDAHMARRRHPPGASKGNTAGSSPVWRGNRVNTTIRDPHLYHLTSLGALEISLRVGITSGGRPQKRAWPCQSICSAQCARLMGAIGGGPLCGASGDTYLTWPARCGPGPSWTSWRASWISTNECDG